MRTVNATCNEHISAQIAKRLKGFYLRIQKAMALLVTISICLFPSFPATARFNLGAFLEGAARQAEIDRQRELERRQFEAQQAQERERAQQRYELEQQRLQLQQQQQELDRLRLQQQSELLRQQRAQEQQRLAEERARRDAEEAMRTAPVTGTGFFVTPDGYVVTNFHVIEDKSTFAVRDAKGAFYRANVVRGDPANDLALLKIEGRFPALKVGNSASVKKGQRVLAVGYPNVFVQGNESKVTDGIINSLSGYKGEASNFQISVPVQGGNSGGPLVSEAGTVYGVIVAKLNVAASGEVMQNVSYAIKSKVLLDFLATAGVKNVTTFPGKANIAAVDSATVLIIARNGSLEFSYQTSPAERAAEATARQDAAAAEKARLEELRRARAAAIDARVKEQVGTQITSDSVDPDRQLPTVNQDRALSDRYVPSSTGDEVTDSRVGLIWRRCAEGMTWDGSTCIGAFVRYAYASALLHADREAIRTGDAWRVPSADELAGIVDQTQDPTIDRAAFPATPAVAFWHSSTGAGNFTSAGFVVFANGYVVNNNRSGLHAVRLVRSVAK